MASKHSNIIRKIIIGLLCICLLLSLSGCGLIDWAKAVSYNKAAAKYNSSASRYNMLTGSSYYKILSYKEVDWVAVAVDIALIVGVICAFFCRIIVKKKGYPSSTYFGNMLLGFFFGLIGLLIVACKSEYRTPVVYCNVEPISECDGHEECFDSTDDFESEFELESKSEPSNVSVIETIEKLSKLKDMGLITEEEFSVKKKELLNRL